MTTNPPKRKQLLIFAPVGAGGMIPIQMIPKPDGALRMCVDYRALNDCTADVSWPIPDIAETFRRIGSQKPKIFGIMDLTQGYRRNNMIDSQKEYSPEYILSV